MKWLYTERKSSISPVVFFFFFKAFFIGFSEKAHGPWPRANMLTKTAVFQGERVIVMCSWYCSHTDGVPAGPPSRGGNVAVYGFDINQPSLTTTFGSVLESIYVFTALSTVFHSINYPDNFPLSRSVLPVLFLPYWSFQLYSL